MNVERWLAALAPDPESLKQLEKLPLWRKNFAALPDAVATLQPDFYRPLLSGSRYAPALLEQLDAAAAKIRRDPALNGLFALTRELYYGAATEIQPVIGVLNHWIDGRLSAADAGRFRLLLATSAYPLWCRTYAKLGVPQFYADEVFRYFDGAITEFAAGHDGALGFGPSKPNWARHYVEGRLFRIGRFEWMIESAQSWFPALYRSRKTRKIAALCREGQQLRPDGLIQWCDESRTDGLTAHLVSDGKRVTGVPIDPHGFALPDRTLTLDLAEYAPLYQPHDVIPNMHVPGGGGMTPEACRESMRQVAPFFRKRFGVEIPLIACTSWILNPDFMEELPESNLAGLMRRGFLFPFGPARGVEGLIFVFGRDNLADFPGYPADNSLRRAFHRLYDRGKRFKAGGMFILAEDLENGGSPDYSARAVVQGTEPVDAPSGGSVFS